MAALALISRHAAVAWSLSTPRSVCRLTVRVECQLPPLLRLCLQLLLLLLLIHLLVFFSHPHPLFIIRHCVVVLASDNSVLNSII